MNARLPDVEATENWAARFAATLPREGLAVALTGPLGAGKSVLARAVLRTLGVSGVIPSPTYTLVEPYEINDRRVYHVDLYRLGGPDEAEMLGLSELAPGALMLVEWPERGGVRLQFDLRIALEYAGQGRKLQARALTPAGARVLGALGGVTQ